eukprot:GHVS01018630.1.p1 GENE.GHVS01018630.1~~GHVS01018630.1.p1  ORF type:complete len:1080 (+),score=205.66 GHVS01018630.1:262-3240(+)
MAGAFEREFSTSGAGGGLKQSKAHTCDTVYVPLYRVLMELLSTAAFTMKKLKHISDERSGGVGGRSSTGGGGDANCVDVVDVREIHDLCLSLMYLSENPEVIPSMIFDKDPAQHLEVFVNVVTAIMHEAAAEGENLEEVFDALEGVLKAWSSWVSTIHHAALRQHSGRSPSASPSSSPLKTSPPPVQGGSSLSSSMAPHPPPPPPHDCSVAAADVPPWYGQHQQAVHLVLKSFLDDYLKLAGVREVVRQAATPTTTTVGGGGGGGGWQKGNLEVLEFLGLWGTLARTSSMASAKAIIDRVCQQVERLQTARQQPEATTTSAQGGERLLDELSWLVLFSAVFVADSPKDSLLNGNQRIPLEFLADRSTQELVVRLLSFVATLAKNEVSVLKSGVSVSPPVSTDLLENVLLLLGKLSTVYLFRSEYTGSPVKVFPEFISPDNGQVAMAIVVEVIGELLCLMPTEASVTEGCTTVLLRLASTTNPSVVYLWECKPFQAMLGAIPLMSTHEHLYPLLQHTNCSSAIPIANTTSPLKRLSCKTISSLFEAFASSVCTSEYLRGAARQHVEQQGLHRSGTLISVAVSQDRQRKLLQMCEPFKAELRRFTESPVPNPHPLLLNAICVHMAMATGLIRGTSSSVEAFSGWITDIVQCTVKALKSYMLYHDTVYRSLKFLFQLVKSCLRSLQEQPAHSLLTEIEELVREFAKVHGSRFSCKQLEEEIFQNAGVLFKIIAHVADLESSIILPTVAQRVPRTVISCLRALTPFAAKPSLFSYSKAAVAYLLLLQRLMDRHPRELLEQLQLDEVRVIGAALQKGILCGSARLRDPAYEAVHSAAEFLIHEQRARGLTSSNFDEQAGDAFEVTDDPLQTLNKIMAETGMEILFAALDEESQSKNLEMFASALFDILMLLAVRAHLLKQFFLKFCSVYNNHCTQQNEDPIDDRCCRVVEYVMAAAAEGQRAAASGQSVDMQRIKHAQLDRQFQHVFAAFIVEFSLE